MLYTLCQHQSTKHLHQKNISLEDYRLDDTFNDHTMCKNYLYFPNSYSTEEELLTFALSLEPSNANPNEFEYFLYPVHTTLSTYSKTMELIDAFVEEPSASSKNTAETLVNNLIQLIQSEESVENRDTTCNKHQTVINYIDDLEQVELHGLNLMLSTYLANKIRLILEASKASTTNSDTNQPCIHLETFFNNNPLPNIQKLHNIVEYITELESNGLKLMYDLQYDAALELRDHVASDHLSTPLFPTNTFPTAKTPNERESMAQETSSCLHRPNSIALSLTNPTYEESDAALELLDQAASDHLSPPLFPTNTFPIAKTPNERECMVQDAFPCLQRPSSVALPLATPTYEDSDTAQWIFNGLTSPYPSTSALPNTLEEDIKTNTSWFNTNLANEEPINVDTPLHALSLTQDSNNKSTHTPYNSSSQLTYQTPKENALFALYQSLTSEAQRDGNSTSLKYNSNKGIEKDSSQPTRLNKRPAKSTVGYLVGQDNKKIKITYIELDSPSDDTSDKINTNSKKINPASARSKKATSIAVSPKTISIKTTNELSYQDLIEALQQLKVKNKIDTHSRYIPYIKVELNTEKNQWFITKENNHFEIDLVKINLNEWMRCFSKLAKSNASSANNIRQKEYYSIICILNFLTNKTLPEKNFSARAWLAELEFTLNTLTNTEIVLEAQKNLNCILGAFTLIHTHNDLTDTAQIIHAGEIYSLKELHTLFNDIPITFEQKNTQRVTSKKEISTAVNIEGQHFKKICLTLAKLLNQKAEMPTSRINRQAINAAHFSLDARPCEPTAIEPSAPLLELCTYAEERKCSLTMRKSPRKDRRTLQEYKAFKDNIAELIKLANENCPTTKSEPGITHVPCCSSLITQYKKLQKNTSATTKEYLIIDRRSIETVSLAHVKKHELLKFKKIMANRRQCATAHRLCTYNFLQPNSEIDTQLLKSQLELLSQIHLGEQVYSIETHDLSRIRQNYTTILSNFKQGRLSQILESILYPKGENSECEESEENEEDEESETSSPSIVSEQSLLTKNQSTSPKQETISNSFANPLKTA